MAEKIDPRLTTDPDFCYAPRQNNSVTQLLKRYSEPEGVPDKVIARALKVKEADLAKMWVNIIEKARAFFKV